MPIAAAAVIAVVVTFMLRSGVNHATAAGRARMQAARDKLAHIRSNIAGRPRPEPSGTTAAVFAGLSGLTHGALAAWDSGSAGAKIGWWQGRERFHDWLAERRRQRYPTVDVVGGEPEQPPPPQPPAGPQAGTPPAPPPPAAPRPASEPQLSPARPVLTVVPPLPATAGGTMPLIETYGEVTSIAGLRRELGATRASAQADLDNGRGDITRAASEHADAEADAARARAEIARCNHLAEVAPVLLDRDPAAAGLVAACRDTAIGKLNAAQRRIEAAQQLHVAGQARVTAAEAHLATVDRAVAALERHRQMEEARANTPQASSNTSAYATN